MATHAERSGVDLGGWRHGGVSRMHGLRAVAGLAVHIGVLAGFLGIEHVGVAGITRIMAGEVHGARGDFIDGGSAVVAVLAEALGYDVAAYDPERRKATTNRPAKRKR